MQLAPDDLAGAGLGQVGDELDLARHLVGGELAAAEGDDVLGISIGPVVEHDLGLGDLALGLVGAGVDASLP